jgi:hypothetical protein
MNDSQDKKIDDEIDGEPVEEVIQDVTENDQLGTPNPSGGTLNHHGNPAASTGLEGEGDSA